MKVVIDTNVLISGLISPFGPPAQIIDLWVTKKIYRMLKYRNS